MSKSETVTLFVAVSILLRDSQTKAQTVKKQLLCGTADPLDYSSKILLKVYMHCFCG